MSMFNLFVVHFKHLGSVHLGDTTGRYDPFEYSSIESRSITTRFVRDSSGQDEDYKKRNELFNGMTGSWANCTDIDGDEETSALSIERIKKKDHPDEMFTTVSCRKVRYRIKESTFAQSQGLVVGIVSTSSNVSIGFRRRQSIRQTWGQNETGIFFLVDHEWEEIKHEYEEYGDMIWMNKDNLILDGKEGVITYMTQTFLRIVYDFATELKLDVTYLFKTVDDSYVNMKALHNELANKDYWGRCKNKKTSPKRRGESKHSRKLTLSYKTYPEAKYPRFCQKSSYALSWNFIQCASDNSHISKMRFMPLEDVAMGLLAERCLIPPSNVKAEQMINLYRSSLEEEKRRIRMGLPAMKRMKIPIPNMNGRIVQHHIYDDLDMKEHHSVTTKLNLHAMLKRKVMFKDKEKKLKRGGKKVFWNRHDKKKSTRNKRRPKAL